MSFLEPIKHAAIAQVLSCRARAADCGLILSDVLIENLVESRMQALRESGRVEFGGGILKQLIDTFCDSPYLRQENLEDTLTELQSAFYYYKNESYDRLADDEIIARMKQLFDGPAQGDLDYLTSLALEDLCRLADENILF